MSCRYALNDGAYILGALSPAERSEFEQHLPQCPTCREAVATLAVLPGLLGRLDPATAAPSTTAPPTLLPRVLQAAAARRRKERRRQTRLRVAVGAAAAVIAVAIGLGVHVADTRPSGPSTAPSIQQMTYTAMQQTPLKAPIDAEIALSAGEAGTWVSMRCSYEDGKYGSWPVRLVVFPRDGGPADQVGTWMAKSGEEVKLTTLTRYRPDQIARIELQANDQTTLLWWKPA